VAPVAVVVVCRLHSLIPIFIYISVNDDVDAPAEMFWAESNRSVGLLVMLIYFHIIVRCVPLSSILPLLCNT
jgi:hypothetical protein